MAGLILEVQPKQVGEVMEKYSIAQTVVPRQCLLVRWMIGANTVPSM